MSTIELAELVKGIVCEAQALKDRHTTELNAPVNYACVFARNEAEYSELNDAAQKLGKVVMETNSGLLYHITGLETVGGRLKILKIRIPDVTRPERGDADFTVKHYPSFKNTYLSRPGFTLIKRSYMEMIELIEPDCKVRTYFSDPPVDKQFK